MILSLFSPPFPPPFRKYCSRDATAVRTTYPIPCLQQQHRGFASSLPPRWYCPRIHFKASLHARKFPCSTNNAAQLVARCVIFFITDTTVWHIQYVRETCAASVRAAAFLLIASVHKALCKGSGWIGNHVYNGSVIAGCGLPTTLQGKAVVES